MLDLEGDPTPGAPDRLVALSTRFLDFAETAHRARVAVESLQGDGAVLTWIGLSGDAFREQFGEFPEQLRKLYNSHQMAGEALKAYAPKLELAQGQADRALADGRAAHDRLSSLHGQLNLVQADAGSSDRHLSELTNTAAGAPSPDPEQVRQATRDAAAAQQRLTNVRGEVASAQQALDAAKSLVNQAKQLRDTASRECVQKVNDASDAGIQPRSFWQKLGEAFKAIWDAICEVAKWVALVAGVIALVIGGPLAWVALAAGAILLIKAIVDFAQGKGSVMDLVFGVLGVIPCTKGLTSLSRLSQLYKAGGLKEIGKAAFASMKSFANSMITEIKGLGAGVVTIVKNFGGKAKLGLDKLGDLFHGKQPIVPKDVSRPLGVRECVTDPIDVATGEMVLAEVDLELPAPLPFKLERTHLSSYRGGGWFGASWASTLDQRIETDARATLYFAADAMVLAYPAGKPGQAVLPHDGPRWPLTIAADGSARLDTGERVLSFDSAGRLSAVIDRAGNRLRVERDGDGAPVALQHPSGRRVHLDTADGRITGIRLTGVSGGPQVAIASFGYDGDGQLTEAANTSGRPARFRHDDAGRIVQWIDRNGFGYHYTYDEQGRCVGTVGEDGYLSSTLAYEPDRTMFTDSVGHTTAYTFDEYHHRDSVTDPLGNTTRYTWDRHNRLLSRTDPLGHTTRYSYDERARMTTITRPDGSVLDVAPGAVTGGDVNGMPGVAPPLDINRLREPRAERVEALAGRQALRGKEIIRYDDEGYPVERTDALGTVRRTEYGPFGIVLATVDADGLRTAYAYDTELRITSVTDPRGLVWRYAYDAAGRLTEETDFNGRTRRFTYDDAGRLATSTNGFGEITEYVRDPLGNLVERRTPTGSTRYAYDLVGRLVMACTGETTLTVDRDASGRVVAETTDGRTVTFEYDDERGTRLRRTPGGSTSVWTADPFGTPFALSAAGHETLIRRDENGREKRRFLDGRLVLEQRHGSSDVLVEQHLPGVGRRRFEHRADGTVVGIEHWTGRSTFSLDATGRVTSVHGPGRAETYRYEAGRLAAAYDGTLLTAVGAVSCTYDTHGRMTTRTVAGTGTWHFTWDTEDQLITVRTSDGDRWDYVYDPLGRRITKRHLTGAEVVERYEFTWFGSALIEQAHTGADGTLTVTTWDHDPVDGRPIAHTVRAGTDVAFAAIVTDTVGTPTELLGTDGSLLWHDDSTLWGAARTDSCQPLGFPGQYRDAETGLHYNVYRYYDPLTGRYISQDPLGLAPAPDPAAYPDNPLRAADPLGLMCTSPSASGSPHVTPGGADSPGILTMLDETDGTPGTPTFSSRPPSPDPARPSAHLDPRVDPHHVDGLTPNRDNPNGVPRFRTDNNTLFRDDTRFPVDYNGNPHNDPSLPPNGPGIFTTGFAPRDLSNTNLPRFVDGEPGAFVSTTRRQDLNFLGPPNSQNRRVFRFHIQAPGGVDVNATLGSHFSQGQQEVAFLGGIRPQNIVGVEQVTDGTTSFFPVQTRPFVPNPNFDPTAPNPHFPIPAASAHQTPLPAPPPPPTGPLPAPPPPANGRLANQREDRHE